MRVQLRIKENACCGKGFSSKQNVQSVSPDVKTEMTSHQCIVQYVTPIGLKAHVNITERCEMLFKLRVVQSLEKSKMPCVDLVFGRSC